MLRSQMFELLCRGRDLLEDTPLDPLSVRGVAQELQISPFHFIRQFEALFGATPHQFRMQARLERAKVMLALGGHSVTDVCMEVGFASLPRFSETFAARVGTSPSEYRKRARVLVRVPGILPPELFPGCLSLMGRIPAASGSAIFGKHSFSNPVSIGK
jgi:AraC-like DNA-binding protein